MIKSTYVNRELPYKIRSQFVAPISRAYFTAEKIVADYPILKGPMNSNFIANLRQTLVEHEIMRIIKNGKIPDVKCKISNNKKNTHPFLEIYNDTFVATISQVKKPISFPHEAHYRNARAVSNQLSLFEEDNIEPEKIYFIITHGYNNIKPNFICIGLPDSTNKGWIERINVMNEPLIIPSKKETEESLVALNQFAKEVLKSESNNKE